MTKTFRSDPVNRRTRRWRKRTSKRTSTKDWDPRNMKSPKPAKAATFSLRWKEFKRREDKERRQLEPKRDGKTRLRVLIAVFIALGITVTVRLWYLQVLDAEMFKEAATRNQVRISRTQAPRGRILGSDGTVLVDNRVSLSAGINFGPWVSAHSTPYPSR